MTNSFYAKALAVKRVVSNKGKKTGNRWRIVETDKAKMERSRGWIVEHTMPDIETDIH